MPHTLICGVTETGKTTKARAIARAASKFSTVIVYDPVGTETAGGDWPENAIYFNDTAKFLAYVEKINGAEKYSIFVDESADIFSHADKAHQWILTRGRHYGFDVYILCQRPKMIAPSVRHQCSHLYMFRLSPDDQKELLADFGHDRLNIPLDRGDYLKIDSGASFIERGNIFRELNRRTKK